MLGVFWFIIIALFILWLIGLGVHWAVGVVWTLFIIAVVLFLIGIVLTLLRDVFVGIGQHFRPRRPTT